MTALLEPKVVRQTLRWRNRAMLTAFALCGFVFLILPNLVIWWGSRELCPSEVTRRGNSDGSAWEILRSDCGGDQGVVWQLRVIPDKGYSTVVMESRGGPEPRGWEQAGYEGDVILSAAPKGETSLRVPLQLDAKGQPMGEVDFRNGQRQDPVARP